MTENDSSTEVVRTALVAINWDGEDPRPVAALIFSLGNELQAAGYSRDDVAEMLKNIGEAFSNM
ncbi:MAG: hypothetical protein RID23_04485 [Roseovarius sp.]